MSRKLTYREISELKQLRDSSVPLWGMGPRNTPILDQETRFYLDAGLAEIVKEDGRVGFRITPAGRAALASVSKEGGDVP